MQHLVTSFLELRNESHRTSHTELNKATHQKRNPHQFCESPFSPKMPRSSAVIILFVEVSSNSAQHREELPMNVNPAAVVGPQSYQTYDSHGGRRFPPLRINNDQPIFWRQGGTSAKIIITIFLVVCPRHPTSSPFETCRATFFCFLYTLIPYKNTL